MTLSSGAIQDVSAEPTSGGPGWWVDQSIVYPGSAGAIRRVSLSDSTRSAASQLDAPKESTQFLAGVLADRRHFAFGSAFVGMRIGSLDGGSTQPALEGTGRGILDAPWIDQRDQTAGHFLFIRDTTLYALDFDGVSGKASSEPQIVAQGVSPFPSGLPESVSVRRHVLAYLDASGATSRIVWVDRQGRTLAPAASLSGVLRDPRLSPDARSVVVGRWNSNERTFELVLVDLARDTISRLTAGMATSVSTWLPDGSGMLVAGTRRGEPSLIYRVGIVEGSAPVAVTDIVKGSSYSPEISRDGQTLAYTKLDSEGNLKIFVRGLTATGDGESFMPGSYYNSSARFSPDGRWMAYTANETGALEVYVRSFPDGREKQQISVSGGHRPVWRRDGKELYYVTPDGDLMAAAVDSTPTFVVTKREKLFRAPIDPTFTTVGTQYDVSPDGQRFVVIFPDPDARRPVNVILNWESLLQK